MRPVGVLLIVICAIALAASDADAAKLRAVTKSGGVGANGTSTGTLVARCPKGTKALSGGFTTSIPDPGTPGVAPHGAPIPGHLFIVSESIMTPRGDGWRVSGSEHIQGSLDGFSAYAYCEKRKRALSIGATIRTDFIPAVVGQSTGNTARCPKGTTAISGGFSTPSLGAYFNRSRGVGRDWSVEVTNFNAISPDAYDVEAYCVRGKVHRAKATGVVGGSYPPPGVATAMTSGCAKGGFVGGGGFGAAPPRFVGSPPRPTSGPLVTGDVLGSKGWSVSYASIDYATDPFTAFGYCRPD